MPVITLLRGQSASFVGDLLVSDHYPQSNIARSRIGRSSELAQFGDNPCSCKPQSVKSSPNL